MLNMSFVVVCLALYNIYSIKFTLKLISISPLSLANSCANLSDFASDELYLRSP